MFSFSGICVQNLNLKLKFEVKKLIFELNLNLLEWDQIRISNFCLFKTLILFQESKCYGQRKELGFSPEIGNI